MKIPSEGGSGGHRGHSNMEHWDYTAAIKAAASRRRRADDSDYTGGGLAEAIPLAQLIVTESFTISGRGTAVLYEGGPAIRFGQTLDIDVLSRDSQPIPASASVESMRTSAGERLALLVKDLTPAEIPAASLIAVWAAA